MFPPPPPPPPARGFKGILLHQNVEFCPFVTELLPTRSTLNHLTEWEGASVRLGGCGLQSRMCRIKSCILSRLEISIGGRMDQIVEDTQKEKQHKKNTTLDQV